MATYSVPGNAFYLALYTVLLFPQLYLGIRLKTWGFLVGMTAGVVLEIVAYTSRVQLGKGQDKFLPYLVAITIGPAFINAAIYLCLARIVIVYGEHLSLLKPRTYTIGFMVADFVALVLQSTGGAIAGGDDKTKFDMGISIVQAGLAWHLVSIAAFVGLAGTFALAAYKRQSEWDSGFLSLQTAHQFRSFLIGLGIATLCIFIRTIYRVAELSAGWDSQIARNEPAFMVLEGVLVLIATTSLTIFHPGIAFRAAGLTRTFI